MCLGANQRARQLRQYTIGPDPSFCIPGSPVQRHLLSNITVSPRKMDREFVIRGDRPALDIKPRALLSPPQKKRLSAVALGLQK